MIATIDWLICVGGPPLALMLAQQAAPNVYSTIADKGVVAAILAAVLIWSKARETRISDESRERERKNSEMGLARENRMADRITKLETSFEERLVQMISARAQADAELAVSERAMCDTMRELIEEIRKRPCLLEQRRNGE
jgi:hypothetical protein